ncbi:MAG TPA: hypothetical protein VF773_06905 [Verrucomicrobiae bacterium]
MAQRLSSTTGWTAASVNFPCSLKFFLALTFLCSSISVFAQTNAVREVNLRAFDLAYDTVTRHLYATSPDHPRHLLQLDPANGAITATFEVGANPERLVLDNQRWLWIALNGESAVVRFNLDTLQTAPKLNLGQGNLQITDFAPVRNDTDSLAVNAGIGTYFIRDGVLLPDSWQQNQNYYVTILGNYVFGSAKLRITPTGLAWEGFGVSGDAEAIGARLYYPGGSFEPFGSGSGLVYLPPLPQQDGAGPQTYAAAFALGLEDNSYFLLSSYFTYHLTRFDRDTGQITGYGTFQPRTTVWPVEMALMGTNRLALTRDDKLLLIDLETLFAPGDLEVSVAVAPNPVAFGRVTAGTVTARNVGAGHVLNVTVTNRLSENARFAEFPTNALQDGFSPLFARDLFRWKFDTLAPGETKSFNVAILPMSAGFFTNFVTASSQFEANLANNTAELKVTVQDDLSKAVSVIAPYTNVTAIAYDPVSDELLVGHGNGRIFQVDLAEAKMSVPYEVGSAPEKISVSAATRSAWVGVAGWDSLYRIPLEGGPLGRAYLLHEQLRDVEASPTIADDVAYSAGTSVRLLSHPGTYNGPGLIEFSDDGKTLYQVYDLDCSLRVLNVTATNLVLARSYPDMPCYPFTQSGGRLYFDNGIVVDPANGSIITNLNLRYPSFVIPDPSGSLNVLTRSGVNWLIRRLDRNTFQELGTFHLTPDYAPTSAISAGTNRIAFVNRTVGGTEAILVNMQASASTLRLDVMQTSTGTILRFPTVPTARYRLEETTSITNPIWTPASETITGTGLIIERFVPASGPATFYRLTQLP